MEANDHRFGTRPTKNALPDRHRRLVPKLIETFAANMVASGIAEVNTEAVEILEDIILEVDANDEIERTM